MNCETREESIKILDKTEKLLYLFQIRGSWPVQYFFDFRGVCFDALLRDDVAKKACFVTEKICFLSIDVEGVVLECFQDDSDVLLMFLE